YSIKQCTAPCAAKIDNREYKKLITDLIKFLRSKRSTILRQLKKQMAEAAEAFAYEKAAMYRDRIRLIERLDRRGTPDENVQPEVFASDPTEALERLQGLLQSAQPVRIIEGIDVACIAGAEAVGSLVKFIDGRPGFSGDIDAWEILACSNFQIRKCFVIDLVCIIRRANILNQAGLGKHCIYFRLGLKKVNGFDFAYHFRDLWPA
ncbi:unnamed protein product, partial [marine sediment metagenome]